MRWELQQEALREQEGGGVWQTLTWPVVAVANSLAALVTSSDAANGAEQPAWGDSRPSRERSRNDRLGPRRVELLLNRAEPVVPQDQQRAVATEAG
jgi:hypothetical protein